MQNHKQKEEEDVEEISGYEGIVRQSKSSFNFKEVGVRQNKYIRHKESVFFLLLSMSMYFAACSGVEQGKYVDCTNKQDKNACCTDSPCADGCRTVVTLCTCNGVPCAYVKGYDEKECIAGSKSKGKAINCCKDAAARACYNKLKTGEWIDLERWSSNGEEEVRLGLF